jgi:hypothetical protein
MTPTPPLAHAGHWLAQLAYVVPLLLVVIALAVSKVRERRAGPEAHEESDTQPSATAGSGDH